MKLSDTLPFLNSPPLYFIKPSHFIAKIWTPFFEKFWKLNTPPYLSSFIQGRFSNYGLGYEYASEARMKRSKTFWAWSEWEKRWSTFLNFLRRGAHFCVTYGLILKTNTNETLSWQQNDQKLISCGWSLFCDPWKHWKTRYFLMFAGGIERYQWYEMR